MTIISQARFICSQAFNLIHVLIRLGQCTKQRAGCLHDTALTLGRCGSVSDPSQWMSMSPERRAGTRGKSIRHGGGAMDLENT